MGYITPLRRSLKEWPCPKSYLICGKSFEILYSSWDSALEAPSKRPYFTNRELHTFLKSETYGILTHANWLQPRHVKGKKKKNSSKIKIINDLNRHWYKTGTQITREGAHLYGVMKWSRNDNFPVLSNKKYRPFPVWLSWLFRFRCHHNFSAAGGTLNTITQIGK